MADSSLLADLGADDSPAPKKSTLMDDLGASSTDWSGSDGSVESTDQGNKPVGAEIGQIGSNVLKHLPRDVIHSLGTLASFFGNNQTPDFNIGGSTPNAMPEAANRTADALENQVPSLKVTNPGPIDRIADSTIQGAMLGPVGGVEGILPSAVSGLTSQSAAEAGAGPLGQFAAGLAPLMPTAAAAGLRGAVRGGEQGRIAMAESKAAADAAGLPSTVGSTSGNPLVQGAEALSSRLPGGGPLREARNVNPNVEASVNDIIKQIHPNYDISPPTPSEAGQEIERGARGSIAKGNAETSAAADEMNAAVGGKDAPMSANRTVQAMQEITHPTGVPEIDQAVTGTKTKVAAGIIKKIEKEPPVPTSYTTDGEGAHTVKSQNGVTEAVEQGDGNIKVTRSDTAPEAQGKGEGTGRLELLAHSATSKGKALVSDISVSPQQAAAYDKLARRGWKVTKNPNATLNPETGNWVSDSPKNPVYKVEAPSTSGGSLTTKTPTEQMHTGEWTYDPKTGKSEPVLQNKTPEVVTQGAEAQLEDKTPWTFDGLRTLRTKIGKQIDWNPANVSLQNTQLKRAYGAMAEDLRDFVASKGPEAEQKYEFFNTVAKQNAENRKFLMKAIRNEGGSGEVFTKAMRGSADDAGRISKIMGAMNDEGKNTFRAVVLHRMGRTAGAQTAPFSADTFIRNWDKMSVEGKNALFGQGASNQVRKGLDSLTDAVRNMQQSGALRSNLSTAIARGVPHMGGLTGVLAGLVAVREVMPSLRLASEHPFMAAGAAAGGLTAAAINPVMSRVLTNPRTITWLATATRAPKGMLPVLLTQLNQMGKKDPDAKALDDLLSGNTGGANSTSQNPTQPVPGGPGADGSDFTNPGKMTKIHTPAGDIQGVDPSTFGSRFNNPKENPESTPPDLPPQPSDNEPAASNQPGLFQRAAGGLLNSVIPSASADEKPTYPGIIGKPEQVARVEKGQFKLLGSSASRADMQSFVDRGEKELKQNEQSFKSMPEIANSPAMKRITEDMRDRIRLVKDLLAKNKDIK